MGLAGMFASCLNKFGAGLHIRLGCVPGSASYASHTAACNTELDQQVVLGQVLALNKRLMDVLEGRGSGASKRQAQLRQKSGLSEALQAFTLDSTAGGLSTCAGCGCQLTVLPADEMTPQACASSVVVV